MGREVAREIVLSAASSKDPNNRPLTYHWRILRGDPAKVKLDVIGNGASAKVTVAFHDPQTLRINNADRETRLVIVGLFAHNGVYFSAPAFFTSFGGDKPVESAPNENNLD